MLEYFVHLDAEDSPPDLVLAIADVPDDLPRQCLAVDELPANWRRSPAPAELARIGDEFAHRASHGVLIVPSALAPNENNWLLNPQHAGFGGVILSRIEPLIYDERMFGASRRRRRKL